MGFFDLQVTVIRHVSTADISTSTRPFSVCPSVPATSTRDWWTTKNSPACAALNGRQGTTYTSKKGCRSTPEFWFGSVNPLIRYQDLTPQTLLQNHPQG